MLISKGYMNKIIGIALGFFVGLSNLSWSGTMSNSLISNSRNWAWIGTYSMGPVWTSPGDAQTFYLASDIEKTFATSNNASTLADGEVFIGMQKELLRSYQGQLGLAVAATSNATLTGNIWDDADPAFNNYIYSYKIQHTHIALKGKLLADWDYFAMPWVSVSLGVGFNNAYGYENTPIIFEAITMPNFKSNSETTFTYTLGIGLQRSLTQNWQVGLGYEFADWGQSHLNRASSQTMNSGLSLNHVYTNGLMFNVTYIA